MPSMPGTATESLHARAFSKTPKIRPSYICRSAGYVGTALTMPCSFAHSDPSPMDFPFCDFVYILDDLYQYSTWACINCSFVNVINYVNK